MRCAQLVGLSGWMQRIGKQQQSSSELIVPCSQHAGLASTVGVTAQEDAALYGRAHKSHGPTQTFLVGGRASGKRRTMRTLLAERQVAAQHSKAGLGERAGQGDEQA